jgi:hypothetical protein
MYIEEKPLKPLWIVIGIAACVMLVLIGLRWQDVSATRLSSDFPILGAQNGSVQMNPFLELLKLLVAAGCGVIVTWVHGRCEREKPISRSVQHAQVLICVSAAVMMIIIGDSVARALGIAGGASLIRFRTPVDDPKDAAVFLLLLGIGMASGMGAFAVVGLGTLFISLFLLALDNFGDSREKPMMLAIVATGNDFPATFVHRIFNVYGVEYEPGELVQDKETLVKYKVRLPRNTPIEEMTAQLMGPGILKSVSWDRKDKR